MKTFLLLILIVVFGAFGYYQYNKNTSFEARLRALEATFVTQTSGITIPAPSITPSSLWKNQSSTSIYNAIKKADPTVEIVQADVMFVQEIDLTGDNTPEGIYQTMQGATGTTAMLVMITPDNSIGVGLQKDQDGTVHPVDLTQANSATYSVGYKLLPTEHGFYTYEKSNKSSNATPQISCDDFAAFSWNATTRWFEFNPTLTTKYKSGVCS